VTGAADRRLAVTFLTTRWKLSERSACGLAGISRSALAYRPRRQDEPALLKDLKALASRHPRYGYRRLWAMLRRSGWPKANVKRVRRLCVKLGLKLRRKSRRKRRGQGGSFPCKAEYANHVWTCDFVHDACENGRKLKMLTVVDEFTRQCHRIEVATRLSGHSVLRVMQELFAIHGVPKFLRSDNGPEFIAKALKLGLDQSGCGARYIDPGSPWQNGHCESFNGKFRDECLNLEVFHHPDHARAVVELWRRQYNHDRPHSSLAYRTPQEFAASCVREKKKTNARTAAPAVERLPSGRHRRITPVSSDESKCNQRR
jgi:putative transposase